MTIASLTQDQFEQILNEHIRPSAPIESFEHLFERSKQLDRIEEALSTPGRHIFIYGERGAGKTSLAHTAAYKHNPSSSSPIFTSCGRQTSFQSIVRDIVFGLENRSLLTTADRSKTAGLNFHGGPSMNQSTLQKERPLDSLDLNAATAAINEAAIKREGKSIVVIDEFENLPTIEDQHLFAELVKQLSDRNIPVSLIFCGIGKSLQELLEGHNSVQRYIQEVPVPSPPLSISGRWELIDTACKAFDLDIDKDSRLRIAQVSDGFPHYIHLICQKLFWAAFRSEKSVEQINPDDYMNAVREALESVESRLRQTYDTATKKSRDAYREVLWSVADHFELERNNRRIYNDSYLRVMREVGRPELLFDEFQSHLQDLRNARHGKILTSERRGWVRFSENLIRGYVRLVAESNGVRLALEHEPGPSPKNLTAKTKAQVAPGWSRPRY